jgi:hypothetical protein
MITDFSCPDFPTDACLTSLILKMSETVRLKHASRSLSESQVYVRQSETNETSETGGSFKSTTLGVPTRLTCIFDTFSLSKAGTNVNNAR